MKKKSHKFKIRAMPFPSAILLGTETAARLICETSP